MTFLLKQTLAADRLHRLLAFMADFNEASFPCLARETFEISQFLKDWIGCCDAYGLISANQFDIIFMPLNQTLMHGRWYTTIRMNPITIEEQTIRPFFIDDEEHGEQIIGFPLECLECPHES